MSYQISVLGAGLSVFGRKSRALVGLGRLEEARQALIDGLQFEPADKVSDVFAVKPRRNLAFQPSNVS